MSSPKFAFQCKNCGALAAAEHAGERQVPRSCSTCGHGVRYEATRSSFNIVDEPENWIVLADLKPDELKADFHRHGLKPEHVTRHVPEAGGANVTPKHVTVHGGDTLGTQDKAGV